MPNASIAEWLLRRVTTQERAAAITGDLIEQNTKRASLLFWFSVAGIMLSLSARWLLAFIIAWQVGNWTFSHFLRSSGILGFIETEGFSHHHTGHLFLIFVISLGVVGNFLWQIGLFLAIRYGLRDTMARLTMMLAFAAICALALVGAAVSITNWWAKPAVSAICIFAMLIGAIFSLLTAQRRKVTQALTGTLFVTALAVPVCGSMSGLLMYLISKIPQWAIHTPRSLVFTSVFPVFNMLIFLIEISVCTTMHDRTSPKDTVEI